MSLRGRVERLEQRKSADGLTCPGCGGSGQIFTLNEYVDAAGCTVRLEDWEGNQLPGWPDVSACDLCNSQIKIIVARCPAAADGPT